MRIEFKCGEYNPSQYGKPWGATVEFDGWKMIWDFSAGTFLGDSVKGGKVCVECRPGSTIAVGQDYRDDENYIHKCALYTVERDGSLRLFAEITALEYGSPQPVAEVTVPECGDGA